MNSTIAFLPRNQFHINLFVPVGKYLAEKCGYNIVHIKELGIIEGCSVFEFEREIEKKFHSADISYANLKNIRDKYHDVDFMRAIYCEREFNFFPEYFGDSRVEYEFQIRYLVSCVNVFEEFVANNNIACVISELLTGLPDSILYAVCRKNSVKYLSVRSSKMVPGVIMCDKYYDEPIGMAEAFESYKKSGIPDELRLKAVQHMDGIRKKMEAPAYMQLTKNKFKLVTLQRLKTLARRVGQEKIETTSISLYQHPILNPARWALRRFVNIRETRRSFSKWFCTKIPHGENYFIYPLHYEPEASTLVRAFQFSDQMAVIRQIARVLPLGIRLVVKEHKGNQGYRKSDFYKKLYYLPNVLLVSPDYDSKGLLKNSMGVITLTGRMGWEALVMSKPVIAFGETFWTSFREVKKPESWRELSDCLIKIVDDIKRHDDGCSGKINDELIAYAAAYISRVYDANFVLGTDGLYHDANVEKIGRMLYDEIASDGKNCSRGLKLA